MTLEQWRAQTIAIIGKPISPKQKAEKLVNAAFSAVHKSFGPTHQAAASTCADVLSVLILVAQKRGGLEHGIEGKTQVEIAAQFKWSASAVSRYTRHMEALGLLRIERRRRAEGKYKGTSLPNSYYFTFVGEKMALSGEHLIATNIHYRS
jgi:hypothetical protein